MFPPELTQYKSWVVWRYEPIKDRPLKKPTKIPYNALTNGKADSTDPTTWTTYANAVAAYLRAPDYYNGIGFVLSEADPYAVVDIDPPDGDPHREAIALRVLDAFEDTYVERSPSKEGFHVWLIGELPNERKRDGIEVYATKRYFTMTGDVTNDNIIIRKDHELLSLWHELGGAKKELADIIEGSPENYLDTEIYNMGCSAQGEKNPGEHFHDLFNGSWAKWHHSQSQADIALVNFLSFYSRNPDQIRRMFLASAMGKRPKAHRGPTKGKQLGYLDEMIHKSFDNMAPEISIDMLMGNLEKQLAEERAKLAENPVSLLGNDWTFPPGLIGQVADYIYRSAPRPVKEIALAAAIGIVAGIAGRAYNISNTGLNQYILVLAQTGCGKEAMKSGVSRLIKACMDPNRPNCVPVAGEFIGPATIASGQALVKYLAKNQCFVSVLGEFGLTLQQMCSPMANNSQIMLRQILLDLYTKSGINESLGQTIYSDKDKSTDIVHSPNFSILAETTPDSYFPHLNEDMVAQGLIPRFTTIEYTGKRVSLNKAHSSVKPSDDLVSGMVQLMTNSLTLQQHMKAIEVAAEDDAQDALDEFDRYCDDRHRNAESDVARHLWSRGHVKLLKLAALIAVGVHAYEPSITLDQVVWARVAIEADIVNVIGRFESGKVGQDASEQQQTSLIVDAIKDFLLRPFDNTMKDKYRVDERFHRDRIVTWGYLQMRLVQKAAFKKDRMGATIALKRAVENMVSEGALSKVNGLTMFQRYESTAQAFAVTNLSRFTAL